MTSTVYFFDVAADALEGALDRFSGFFIEPLFNEVSPYTSLLTTGLYRAGDQSGRFRAQEEHPKRHVAVLSNGEARLPLRPPISQIRHWQLRDSLVHTQSLWPRPPSTVNLMVGEGVLCSKDEACSHRQGGCGDSGAMGQVTVRGGTDSHRREARSRPGRGSDSVRGEPHRPGADGRESQVDYADASSSHSHAPCKTVAGSKSYSPFPIWTISTNQRWVTEG